MAVREWISKEHKIFKLGENYYARPTIPGIGRREFALKAKTNAIRDLIRIKDRKIAEMIRASKPKPVSLIRVEDIVAEILKLKKGRAPATYYSANTHFNKHILPWFNIRCPYMDQVDEVIIEEYIQASLAVTPNRKMFNDVKHLQMMVNHAFNKGILKRKIKVRNPDPKVDAGRRLTESEIQKLFKHAGPELYGQLLMAVTMGMRKSEILLLAWDRVDLVKKTIHLRAQDTKTRNPRTMGMSVQVWGWLSTQERKGPYVFASRYDRNLPTRSNKTAWIACKRRAGVKCRFHDTRHTYLSVALLERKLNPLHVAVYAGVSLQEIQRTYLHPSVEDTREMAGVWGNVG